jgi:photosystem II stability/assembly factor-like uncharacterized protein
MNIYILPLLLLFQISFSQAFSQQDSAYRPQSARAGAAKFIFKSADGGQSWLDISEGLPENSPRNGFITNESGVHLRAGDVTYHSMPNSKAPYWKKEIFSDKNSSIKWAAMYTNSQEQDVRTVFEASTGTVFIGRDNGLFKSTNNGKTWKQVHSGGWVIKLVESKGIMVATSQGGIIRSTDGGENWETVISEGGVGIDVQPIDGGFAAITFNTQSETRRVRTSYDGGKTWQAIDAGLPQSPSISSIIQVGENFFCGHPRGIYKSSDNGKTWKLIIPSTGDKVFKLSVSGNMIYAVLVEEGC